MQRNLIQSDKSNSPPSLDYDKDIVLSLFEHVICESLYTPRSLLQMKKFPFQKLALNNSQLIFQLNQQIFQLKEIGLSSTKFLRQMIQLNEYLSLPLQLQLSSLINLKVAAEIIENSGKTPLSNLRTQMKNFAYSLPRYKILFRTENSNMEYLKLTLKLIELQKIFLKYAKNLSLLYLNFTVSTNCKIIWLTFNEFIEGSLLNEDSFNFDNQSNIEDIFAELVIPQPKES